MTTLSQAIRPLNRNTRRVAWVSLLLGSILVMPAAAQIRVVTYNTAEGALSQLSTVLPAIGELSQNGIAKPIDVLSLQEQTSLSTTTQSIVDQLNAIYGADVYARGTLNPSTNGAGRVAIVYNTQTVDLIDEDRVNSPSGVGGGRQTMRYQFRPLQDDGFGGNLYEASADFYVYGSHYKASDNSTDAARRNVEATQIRNNADALGDGANLIFTGDLNLYRSSEPAYQTLLSSGDGQAIDPLNPNNVTQSWNNNSSFASFHTQSPCTSSTGNCGVGGGVDSRFDFQLVSEEVFDNDGFALIPSSYTPFGNNGSTYNDDITDGNTVTFPGVTSFTKPEILSALRTATDHLPVLADYQVPAVLSALVDTIPSTLELGELFDLALTVSNAADVVAALGADELDYTITTTGDLAGLFSDSDLALGGGNLHEVTFDTSSAGFKSGEIVISSTSQAAANSLISIPLSFEVLAAGLTGDFNNDGFVDAADYTVWRDGGPLANEVAPIGVADAADYAAWQSNYGATSSSVSVPEPSSLLLAALVSLGGLRSRRHG